VAAGSYARLEGLMIRRQTERDRRKTYLKVHYKKMDEVNFGAGL